MNKSNRKKTVIKTDKLNQRKLTKVANRFGISPLSVRELQLGFAESIPERAANKLIKEGYAEATKEKLRDHQTRIDSLTIKKSEPVSDLSNEETSTTENVEPITESDGEDTFSISDNPTVTSDPDDNDEEL